MFVSRIQTSKLARIITVIGNYHYARITKQTAIKQVPSQSSSLSSQYNRQIKSQIITPTYQSYKTLTSTLLHHCKQKNQQQATQILTKQFYQNLQNYPKLQKLLHIKNSVDYYFRAYPQLQMNIQNLQQITKQKTNQSINYIRKILLYILYDHQSLDKILRNKVNRINRNKLDYFSLYIKSLGNLVIGQFQQAEQVMLQLINRDINQIIGQEMDTSQVSMQLLDTQNPSYLNIKQQILFNLLYFKMYISAQLQTQASSSQGNNQNKAKSLYKKIKQNQPLTSSDLQLITIQNYQNFLNLWLSAKYDAPMQWQDLPTQQLQTYLKYLYILAQNSYLQKNPQKCNKILQYLPKNYPLRQFLQISQLYDKKQYSKLKQRIQQIQKNKMEDKNRYYKMPQFDIILINVLEIMKKMQEQIAISKKLYKNNNKINTNGNTNKKDNHNQQQQQQQQQQIAQEDIFVKQLQCSIKILKYNYNIKNMESKGIPFYYLNIPFIDFIVQPYFQQLYVE